MSKYANIPEYSVSEISNTIKTTLEGHFSYLKIRGEVSGLKIHSSGHIYFNLKDENSVLNAVCFRNQASTLRTLPEEGLEIIVTGKITTYKQRSNYQILVSNIEHAGAGALMALYEKRKKMLEAQGYFALEHKIPIPKIPTRIAVITSETGAVFHDICHRIKERFPCHIMLFPSLVQGKGAEMLIANRLCQINELDDNSKPDVIIIARGGGSIEDLWCFNEEIVIKSVFNSKIPVISAIGHETDTTLIDYVSDLRAPTPTAAAELATAVRSELITQINEYLYRNNIKLSEYISAKEKIINYLSLTLKKPDNILNYFYQRLDDLEELLTQKTTVNITNITNKVESFGLKLISPKAYLNFIQQKLNNFIIKNSLIFNKLENILLKITEESHKLNLHVTNSIKNKNLSVNNLSNILESLSYKNVLKRGYVVIRDNNKKVITKASKIPIDGKLEAEFQDAKVNLYSSFSKERRKG